METAARGTTTAPSRMSAEFSMPPVYRVWGIAPTIVPDVWGGCDGCACSLRGITTVSSTTGHGFPVSADCGNYPNEGYSIACICAGDCLERRVTGFTCGSRLSSSRSGSVSTGGLPTIWELVAEAAGKLPEPFSRAALINWISARRPDVGIASIATHIQFATANSGSTGHNPFDSRTPL